MADKMIFQKPEDLRQVIGWKIDNVKLVEGQPLQITLSHIEAPNKQVLIINSLITVNMNGSMTMHTAGLQISTEPIKEG